MKHIYLPLAISVVIGLSAPVYSQNRFKDIIISDSLFVGAPGFPAGFGEDLYETAIQHSIDNKFDFISATVTNGAPEDTPEVVLQRMTDTFRSIPWMIFSRQNATARSIRRRWDIPLPIKHIYWISKSRKRARIYKSCC